jgi:hypothetical protein
MKQTLGCRLIRNLRVRTRLTGRECSRPAEHPSSARPPCRGPRPISDSLCTGDLIEFPFMGGSESPRGAL